MTSTTLSVDLDTEELMHLGATLAAQGRLEDALRHFKGAVQQEPGNARANYLLGAHYAQIGMQQRAADFMRRAASLDEELILASFQAGWLLMGLNRGEEAHASWEPVFRLVPEHPLHLMARGLQALMRDDFTGCRDYLTQGMAANRAVPALNEDMRKILAELEQRGLLADPGSPGIAAATTAGYGPR